MSRMEYLGHVVGGGMVALPVRKKRCEGFLVLLDSVHLPVAFFSRQLRGS